MTFGGGAGSTSYRRGSVEPSSASHSKSADHVPFDGVDAQWVIEVTARCRRPGRRCLRRAADILVGSFGLLMLAAAWPWIALAIKLDDPGPVFFSQARMGRDGCSFRMYKFRTMRRSARIGERWTAVDDHRTTRVGRVLRRHRIDEWPQFINVLRGDMAVVGPRPEQSGLARQLQTHLPQYGLRHLVRPGITGWAQIRLGYVDSVEGSRRKLGYDLYYLSRHGIVFDLEIMLRTVRVLVARLGAR